MTRPIYLNFIDILRERLTSDNRLIQVILGPRQVGKTTTVLKLIEDHYQDRALYISTEDTFNPDSAWLQEQWIAAQTSAKILFIDEIQKSQNWSGTIKALFDESKRKKKEVQCVLLGSSSLEIQTGLTESLTGRFQLIRAYHWNYAESKLGYKLTFEEYCKYGGYPGSYHLRNEQSWADYVKNSIVSTVIEKDILLYQRVRNPALFRQAFEILISYPAQEISYTKLLGQLQDRGNVELVKYYINLYEGAFLIKALEKFSNKTTLRKASSPKILLLAPCLSYLQIRAEYSEQELGRVFESMVGAQLHRTGEDLYYWREGKNEVDFVLKIGKLIYAIEVKSGKRQSRRGLEVFKKKFPSAQLVLINREDYLDFEKDPLLFLEQRSF